MSNVTAYRSPNPQTLHRNANADERRFLAVAAILVVFGALIALPAAMDKGRKRIFSYSIGSVEVLEAKAASIGRRSCLFQ